MILDLGAIAMIDEDVDHGCFINAIVIIISDEKGVLPNR
jgi:hypothetical protein